MNGPWPSHTLTWPRVDHWPEVVAHELGHNFGAHHASCISSGNRGAVAWCDSDATITSGDCNGVAAGWNEYCSPHSIMGAGGIAQPFYMDGKLTFDWADSANNPALVSSISLDPSTSSYAACDPSCTFLLQRSDAATLDTSASAVILLQTAHSSSNGNRYFVMEHRYVDTPVLLIHWSDIQPSFGGTGTYGNTVLTDCNPETTTWDDAGCSLGQFIELDTGDELEPMKVWVYVDSALESGKLKVTLSTGVAVVPPQPPPPPASPPASPCVDITLKSRGWQLISFNCIDLQSNSLNNILQCHPDVVDDKILSREGILVFATCDGANWVGSLTQLSYARGYKIYFSGAAGSLIPQRGAPQLPVADVRLSGGWNWIGHAPLVTYYLNQVVTDVSSTFSVDDQIKTRSGNSVLFATYSGSRFEGSLYLLEPGVGYEAKVRQTVTFGYTGVTSPPPSPPPPSPSPLPPSPSPPPPSPSPPPPSPSPPPPSPSLPPSPPPPSPPPPSP